MVLLLHSQHQYIFDYDSGDRLSAVTMPSVARHTMQTLRSVGYYRNIYTPPESNASVTVDYSEDGQVGGPDLLNRHLCHFPFDFKAVLPLSVLTGWSVQLDSHL